MNVKLRAGCGICQACHGIAEIAVGGCWVLDRWCTGVIEDREQLWWCEFVEPLCISLMGYPNPG